MNNRNLIGLFMVFSFTRNWLHTISRLALLVVGDVQTEIINALCDRMPSGAPWLRSAAVSGPELLFSPTLVPGQDERHPGTAPSSFSSTTMLDFLRDRLAFTSSRFNG